MKKKRAVLFVLLAGILWGALGITVKVLSAMDLTAIQIVVCRFWGAAVILAGYFGIRDRQKLRIHKKDIRYFAAFGLGCFLFYNICYTVTIKLTSLSVAVALLYTSPIWAMLLSIPLFKEKLTVKKAAAIILSFTGCGLLSGILSGQGLSFAPLGILTGLLAGVGYGSYGVLVKVLTSRYESWTITFYTFLTAGIGGLFLCNVGELSGKVVRNPVIIPVVFLASLVCFVLPFGIYNIALRDLEASKAAVIVSIEPVMATVYGVVLYQEPLNAPIVLGMACVLGAIMILNKS